MTLILSGTDGVSDIDGTAATPAIRGTDANTGIFFPAADTIAFAEGGAEAMRIDSSGNLGLGVTPSAWYSNQRAFQIGDVGSFRVASSSVFGMNNNAYFAQATTDWRYSVTGFSTRYDQESGQHRWYTAPSGTAGNAISFTQAMTLDASGNLGVGETSIAADTRLHLKSAGDIKLKVETTNNTLASGNAALVLTTGSYGYSIQNLTTTAGSAGVLRFYDNTAAVERARITSGGFFKQSNTGSYNDATNTFNEFNSDVSNNPCVTIRSTNASYAANSEEILPTRSATSSYSFYVAASGAGTDIEFKLRGDGNGYADGTWNNNGADYAEFFESANGEALTLGATVVLDGNKVREATSQDPASAIIGVVRPKEPSKASMVVGNTAWNKWANKYLTDDFDRYIMEDHDVVEWEETITDEEGKTSTKQHSYESHNIPAGVTVPADAVRKTHDDKGNKFQHYKLNPAWDKDAEYVNRENRPEWNIIGLLGQVKILKGQPVGDRWIKMRDVSATVEEWMIR